MPAPFKVVIPRKSDVVFTTGNILSDTGTFIVRDIAVEIEQPLLKSAPELLEALQSLINDYDSFRARSGRTDAPQNQLMLNARAAIAKALGETK